MAAIPNSRYSILFRLFIISILITIAICKKGKDTKQDDKSKEKIGKNILDYTEADMQRLLDQWEVSDHLFISLIILSLLLCYV